MLWQRGCVLFVGKGFAEKALKPSTAPYPKQRYTVECLITLSCARRSRQERDGCSVAGGPRLCVTDEAAERVFLCISNPSMILAARLPNLSDPIFWGLPSGGAHGLDIDHARDRLYAACDDGALVELDSISGKVTNV
jgi:hypothetical protein